MTPAMPSVCVRQLCTRMLIVVAGVVAGISAAWLFAASAASAAPAEVTTGNLSAGSPAAYSSSAGHDSPLDPVGDVVGDARHSVETDARHAVEKSADSAATAANSVARSAGKVASELGDKAATVAEAVGQGADPAAHAGVGQAGHEVTQAAHDVSGAVRSTVRGVSGSTGADSWLSVPELNTEAEHALGFVNRFVFDKTVLAPITVLGDIDGTFHGFLDEVRGKPAAGGSGVAAVTSPMRSPATPRTAAPQQHETPDGSDRVARQTSESSAQAGARADTDGSPRPVSGSPLELPHGNTASLGQHDVQLGFLEADAAATPSHPLARVTAPALSRPAKQAVRPVNSPD